MILIKTIRWKNILSTGNVFTEIRLDKSPNTLVVGDNGAGKSTMLDVLCFVLYNKAFRKVKKDQLINAINQGDAVGEVEFSAYGHEYKIVRGMKPAIFEIWKDGHLLNQSAASKDYQNILERSILRMNMKSFTQIVILGSSFVPFMQLPTNVRREVIEDLLDIRIFSTMQSLLKNDQIQLKEDLMLLDKDIAATTQLMKVQKDYLDNVSKGKQKELDECSDRIGELEKKIEQNDVQSVRARKKIEEYQGLIIDAANVSRNIREIEKIQSGLESKRRAALKSVEFYETNDHCPTCTQAIDVAIKATKIEEKTKVTEQIDTALGDLSNKYAAATKRLSEIGEYQQEINKLERYVEDLRFITKSDSREILIYRTRWEDLMKSNNQDIQAEIDNLQKTLDAHGKRKEALTHSRELHDVASVILRDTGIKARIVKQYIPVINALVNKYLAAMDFFVKFELNENFEEKILSRHRDEFTYDSFSEGEKMRIDLALLFTWRTIARMKNSASTNLLILDEVFDASLDASGCEEFLKMVHGLEHANVFVISHKGDLLQDKFRSSIRFVKIGNYSKIEI